MKKNTSITDMIGSVQKYNASVRQAVSPLLNLRNMIQESMSPISALIQEHQERVRKVLGGDLQARIREAADDVERCKGILLEFGFPPHNDISIKQMRMIASHYTVNGRESTDQLLNDFITRFFSNERIEGYLRQWEKIEWLQSRILILKEVVRAHSSGMYFASISTLIPQIEGVITQQSGLSKSSRSNLIDSLEKVLNQEGSFSLDDTVLLFYVDFILVNFDLGKEIKSPLSRHAIAHGADTKFGFQLNSIRCIVFFDYLIQKYLNPEE